MTNYIDKYLDDLYHLKITQKEIIKIERISRSKLKKDMGKEGLLTLQQWNVKIDTGIQELNIKLKETYSGIATRCKGNTSDKYKLKTYNGLDYLSIIEWVKFCNQNKKRLNELWNLYIEHDRELKYQVSIDRIDNDKGYVLNNIQFVSYGFNSWKRNINPLRVKKDNGDWKYFMSAEESSEYYNIRRQSIGDLLRGQYREVSDIFEVERSAVNEVLEANNIDTLEGYYYKLQGR